MILNRWHELPWLIIARVAFGFGAFGFTLALCGWWFRSAFVNYFGAMILFAAVGIMLMPLVLAIIQLVIFRCSTIRDRRGRRRMT